MNDELSILHIGNDNGIYHCSNNITSNNITVINSDCIGESSNNVNTSFSDTTCVQCFSDKNIYANKIISIYRYKFTPEFTDELLRFSKIHQYDQRKDFKESWDNWIEENADIVDDEIRRLQNLGYIGDIKDKMFKSSRYYFRKKTTEKKEPKKRRDYIGVKKDLLEMMDIHIKNNIFNESYKPSNGFDDFCKNNIELLKEEVNILIQHGFTDSDEIKRKIKKTYKNRYFLINK